MTHARDLPSMFQVAFSLAGEQRALVRSIAEAVEQRLGRGTVFYDEWFEHYIAGDDADLRLMDIYGKRSELIVVCISERYGGKPWTRAEHKAIRARQMQLYESADERDSLRILPLRVGDGDVKGIPFNTISPDVRDRPAPQTADFIVDRLRLILPGAGADSIVRRVAAAVEKAGSATSAPKPAVSPRMPSAPPTPYVAPAQSAGRRSQRVTCGRCLGSGNGAVCSVCHGNKIGPPRDMGSSLLFRDAGSLPDPCFACSGRGYKDCEDCQGKGTVIPPNA